MNNLWCTNYSSVGINNIGFTVKAFFALNSRSEADVAFILSMNVRMVGILTFMG